MSTTPPVRVFVSYARADKKFMDEFVDHVSSLVDQSGVEMFYDRMISPGKWEKQLFAHLDNADIFVALLTRRYRNSDYCYREEFHRALTRIGAENIFVIYVSYVHLDADDPLRELQFYPSGQPISGFEGGQTGSGPPSSRNLTSWLTECVVGMSRLMPTRR